MSSWRACGGGIQVVGCVRSQESGQPELGRAGGSTEVELLIGGKRDSARYTLTIV